MKKFILSLIISLAAVGMSAQEAPAPKWVSKAQKSVYSVLTYNDKNELLHEGTGFAVTDNGVLISDYDTFKGAYSGVAVDASGTKHKVERILGANDLYGLVRFKIAQAKTSPLTLAGAQSAQAGSTVYALGYTKGKVNVVQKSTVAKKEVVDSLYNYFSMNSAFDGKQQGKGLFTTTGEFLGIIMSTVNGKSGAIDGKMGKELTLAALQNRSQSLAYNNIFIKKGIPETAEEALIYLYMKSRTAGNDEYMDLVNLFINTFPDNAQGYLRRATPLIDLHRFDEADQDLQTYLSKAQDKNQAHADIAKTIYSKLVYMPEPAYDKWTYAVALEHVDKAIEGMRPESEAEKNEEMKVLKTNALYETILLKAQMLSSSGDHRAAISIYDEINSSPYKAPATFLASSLEHGAAGDSTDIQIALLDSAIAQFPDSLPMDAAGYVMSRAKLYEQSGQFRKAVSDYNLFEQLNNNNVRHTFYYDRSQVELRGKMYQQALNDINKAVEIAPTVPLYWVEKSAMHLRVNQIDECIAAAEKCISLSEKYPDAYRILGYAQIQKGDKQSARKNLEKAKELGDESAQEIMDKYL